MEGRKGESSGPRDSVLDTILPSSMQSPPTFLKTFETFPNKTPDSMADEDPSCLALLDSVINTYTDYLGPSYCGSEHATSEADQWIAERGRRAGEEHTPPGLKPSNEQDIEARTQRKGLCEGYADKGLLAPEISSSHTIGPMDDRVSRSGCDATTTESGKTRKQKSPEQIE